MPSPVAVYYHADCLDGFGAAYCAWRHFGEGAEYLPLHHGETWAAEQVAGRTVCILDFSFSRQSVEALAALASTTLLLDHHATPCRDWEADLRDDPWTGCRQAVYPAIGLTVAFDMRRSGARLAWDRFFPGQSLPRAIALIEDIDLWRFAYPETRAFGRALRLQPFSFAVWDGIVASGGTAEAPVDSEAFLRLLQDGEAIERFFATETIRLATTAVPVSLLGQSGLAVNANGIFASELGDVLARQSGGFGMVWHVRSGGLVKASLRSRGAVDVARVAEQFGGGGHAQAAGFSVSLVRFAELFPELFGG